MKAILAQPLAEFLGINECTDPNYLLEIDYSSKLTNHYNSFHASAIFSFAEYSAGAFLVVNFPEQRHTTLPIVRRAQIKYTHKPSLNTLRSKGQLVDTTIEHVIKNLEQKGRALIEIQISVVDDSENLVFIGNFEWFVTMKP